MLKFSLFYTAFLVFSLIFDVDFLDQLFFLFRLSYILLLSVYLIKTTSRNAFSSDTTSWQSYRFLSQLRFFILAVFLFLQDLAERFREIRKSNNKLSLQYVFDILHSSIKTIPDQEQKLDEPANIKIRRFYWWENMLFIPALILYTLDLLVF
jgi:hypothetical protein